MTWLAIPNVSEGRDEKRIASMSRAIVPSGCKIIDVHSDGAHNRSVLTVTGAPQDIPAAMAELAASCSYIDLTRHSGVHPRLGRLDVCPIVGLDEPPDAVVDVARQTGVAIHARTGLPIYYYGEAALRAATAELPALRTGGLKALAARAESELPPDLGAPPVDMRAGVVCVGARGVLIAFNVWLRCDLPTAKRIAARVRTSGGGPSGVRALGLHIDDRPTAQVSLNLIDPETTGIDAAFRSVADEASRQKCSIVGTEIVGLVPEKFLPDPDAQAARLLIRPGRSVEAAMN
jgi:glutamate formiminotransferase